MIRIPVQKTHARISKDPKFSPFFDNCRMAVDGTHIPAMVPAAKCQPFRNRKGALSQNVLAACDMDLCFTYVLAGWEGSASDSAMLTDALTKGYTIEEDRFDLGDAGFGLKPWLLTPYRGVRYHLKEWSNAGDRFL
jgi:hypothetical protein